MFDAPLNNPEFFHEHDPADRPGESAPDFDFRMDSLPDGADRDWPFEPTEDHPCLAPIDEQSALSPMTAPDDIGHEGDPEPVVSAAPEVIPGLSFMVPHDGTQAEVTSAEQALVARGFGALASDLLLSHIDSVHHTEVVISGDWLRLRLPVSKDSYWSISVEAREQPAGGGETEVFETISLQRIEGGLGREGARYYKDPDGVVRRHTRSDTATQFARQSEYLNSLGLTEDAGSAERLRIAEEFDRRLDNETRNQRLDMDMGYNHQPVGIQELNSLVDFISQPGVVPNPLY